MSKVKINPQILKWSIARAGLDDRALRGAFPKLDLWLSNEQSPTLNQLNKLSKKVRIPVGYFFLNEPPKEELPYPFFRTHPDSKPIAPSPELIDTVHLMQRRMNWMSEYLIETGEDKLDFIGSAAIGDDPQLIADSIRNVLGLDKSWAQEYGTWEHALRFLYHRIDEIGINVVVNGIVGNNTHRKLNPREFRGFVIVDDYAPILFVNNSDGKAAQMFTIAHELAHLWFGESAIFDLEGLKPSEHQLELACDKVAAEFLVPKDELKEAWKTVKDCEDCYQLLAKKFKVSEIVITRRLLDLRLITRSDFFEFYENYLEELRNKRQETGGSFYRNQGMKIGDTFLQTVVRALGEERLQYIEAFRLTSLYGATFDKYVSDRLEGF